MTFAREMFYILRQNWTYSGFSLPTACALRLPSTCNQAQQETLSWILSTRHALVPRRMRGHRKLGAHPWLLMTFHPRSTRIFRYRVLYAAARPTRPPCGGTPELASPVFRHPERWFRVSGCERIRTASFPRHTHTHTHAHTYVQTYARTYRTAPQPRR